jgi:hypothetical protein
VNLTPLERNRRGKIEGAGNAVQRVLDFQK